MSRSFSLRPAQTTRRWRAGDLHQPADARPVRHRLGQLPGVRRAVAVDDQLGEQDQLAPSAAACSHQASMACRTRSGSPRNPFMLTAATRVVLIRGHPRKEDFDFADRPSRILSRPPRLGDPAQTAIEGSQRREDQDHGDRGVDADPDEGPERVHWAGVGRSPSRSRIGAVRPGGTPTRSSRRCQRMGWRERARLSPAADRQTIVWNADRFGSTCRSRGQPTAIRT